VRELSNLVERLRILHLNHEVQVEDLPEKYRQYALSSRVFDAMKSDSVDSSVGNVVTHHTPALNDEIDLKSYLEGIELQFIEQALEKTEGVVAHAAKLLGLRRTTLVEKLRKYGLQREGAAS
jgi:sigma-54 specific flagellar transcriptional regulator A